MDYPFQIATTLPWLLFIFLAIVVLGLLHLAENRASTSNASGEEDQSLKPEEQEQEQPSDLIVYSSEGLQQPGSRTATAHSGASACAFCGNLSTTKCSRCKTARYCSKECQIRHWISVHKYECVETEPVDQERHGGGASRTVKKTKRESSNGSNAVEWNSQVGEVHSNDNATRQPTDASGEAAGSSYSCAVCGCAATIRCPRCKAVEYCSVKCLIEDWGWHKVHCIAVEEDITQTQTPPLGNVGIGLLKNSNEEEDNDHSPRPLSLEFYPEGTANTRPLIRSSQEPTKKAHDHTVEGVRLRCLEEEVAKSRNEIMFLQSERDEWAMRANFVKKRYLNYKKESDHQLFVLKNEKKLISNAEKQAQHVVNNLWERLQYLQIAVEASNAEKGKQEEHIQMLESKCARLKRELQEEREHIQGLTTERDESLKTAQITMRELEEKGKELQVERDRIQRLKEDYVKDVAASESRAVEAEEKLHDLEQKIRSTKNKVGVWRDSLGKPAMACAICLTNEKDLAFGCGHMTCRDCGSKISKCPICREQITSLVRLFPG